ncbi:hypothetical protein AAFF_G00338390 [Aldrovandia affinis]|uniref:Uncharacterized protein n=1 Tax=Aldrovandia affinis TaxID=143900 RepID=A0AAD7R6D0_9TELE|nr:hypothetical protein AAFF_G00338390 [Aldrovandia affinis]
MRKIRKSRASQCPASCCAVPLRMFAVALSPSWQLIGHPWSPRINGCRPANDLRPWFSDWPAHPPAGPFMSWDYGMGMARESAGQR